MAVGPIFSPGRIVAESGNAVSRDILARASDELCLATGSVVRRLSGLAPGATVRRLVDPPAAGAVHLVLAELTGGAHLRAYV